MVGPNDPYQDRPLPYVIGSDKWLWSNKIGLESSSSESEQLDEEREESESDREEDDARKVFNSRHKPEINIARLSSSSDSDNYNDPSGIAPYMNNSKADTVSQNNINSVSESVTPNNVSKVIDILDRAIYSRFVFVFCEFLTNSSVTFSAVDLERYDA